LASFGIGSYGFINPIYRPFFTSFTGTVELIRVNGSLWSKVKDYATVKNLVLHSGVELVLREAPIASGYHAKKEEDLE
jgi:hypothetical protein